MLDILKTLHKPDKIYSTGEAPILVTCEDFQTWVCKHGRMSNSHLFNELIASRFANIWGIRTPLICLIEVLEDHLPIENANILQPAFFKKPCFGSLYIEYSKEIDSTLVHSFEDTAFRKKVKNKEDFLTIALFDIWLSNEDRNHNNSNLLLDFTNNEEYYFCAFDHNSIFNSNSLHHGLYQISEDESIINTDLAKILFKQGRNLTIIVEKIIKKFYLCIEECERELGGILGDIPSEWNLNVNQLELLLRQNLFTESWIRECENNFRTIIQTYI